MKPPRAKVIRMHKLLDEALGLWPDVRQWYVATMPENPKQAGEEGWRTSVDELEKDLYWVAEVFRDLRNEVEQ